MQVLQVDMFAEEAAAAAHPSEVSNTASLANVEHHAHLTDNWDDAEGYYRVQVGAVLIDQSLGLNCQKCSPDVGDP